MSTRNTNWWWIFLAVLVGSSLFAGIAAAQTCALEDCHLNWNWDANAQPTGVVATNWVAKCGEQQGGPYQHVHTTTDLGVPDTGGRYDGRYKILMADVVPGPGTYWCVVSPQTDRYNEANANSVLSNEASAAATWTPPAQPGDLQISLHGEFRVTVTVTQGGQVVSMVTHELPVVVQ